MTTSDTTTEIGDLGLLVSAAGAIGYVVTIALPDDATGFWGVVCDVLTLWGWGPLTSLGLVTVFATLALVAKLSAGFTRAPRWLLVPLVAVAAVAAAPILVLILLVLGLFQGGADTGSPEVW
jgi:hypothetical protein